MAIQDQKNVLIEADSTDWAAGGGLWTSGATQYATPVIELPALGYSAGDIRGVNVVIRVVEAFESAAGGTLEFLIQTDTEDDFSDDPKVIGRTRALTPTELAAGFVVPIDTIPVGGNQYIRLGTTGIDHDFTAGTAVAAFEMGPGQTNLG